MGISVIICCYNSAKRLPDTLRYLSLQKVAADISWEIIIVDNSSKDGTADVAISEWGKYNITISFRVVKEDRQGLIYARERGIKESCYELILFCDDDNWLEENYISYAYDRMHIDKSIAVLGGQSKGHFGIPAPGWLHQYEKAYAIGKPLAQTGIANSRAYIAGAGMVIRRSVLELLYELEFKPLLTGRKGKFLFSGEDSEICLLLVFLGYNLFYDERLQFTHFIPSGRLTWKYCVAMLSNGHAIPQVYFEFYHYIFSQIRNRQQVSFVDAYLYVRKKQIKKFLQAIFPLKKMIKNLICQKQGSKTEIEIKALWNKISYLIKNKKRLEKEFEIMYRVCSNINKYNQRIAANQC